MMNTNTTTEMTRTEMLAEIKRLAALVIQTNENVNPEEALAEIGEEIRSLQTGCFRSNYYVKQTYQRQAETTQARKKTLITMLETMGFKQTGNSIYSLKIGECVGEGDYVMRLNLTTCGEPSATILDDGEYTSVRCKTVDDAERVYKLSKKANILTREIRYGNALNKKLQECVEKINQQED